MHSYRAQLEVRSALGTPLGAETLWGHVAWGICYRRGRQALESWLDRYDGGDPPLVLSDPLPHGCFPRPALPPLPRPDRPPAKKDADARKSLDKLAWIVDEAWLAICDHVSPDSVEAAVVRSLQPHAAVQAAVTRAGINRLTGGTAQLEGGSLFTANQQYYDFRDPPRFDVWCLSPEPCVNVEQWLVDGLAGGYGRDASAGLGHIIVTTVEPADLPASQCANAVVLLGSAVPKPGDPSRGFFRCGVHSGRLGGDFAIGELPGGAVQRQKRPVHCLLAGTVLVAEAELPQCVGRVLRGVHPEIDAVRHFGMTPVLPCRMADDVMERVF